MVAIDPKRRRPDYEAIAAETDFLWSSYEGGTAYDPAEMLDKYPRETGEVFAERKGRAYYLNYVSAGVDAYIAAVFKREPVRETPPSFEDFIEDATGRGDSLSDFVREVMTHSLATTKAYVVVDIDADGQPYVDMIHPANLLDLAQDREGNVLWALVAEQQVSEDDPFQPRGEADVLRLWLPNQWLLFDDKGNEIDGGPNEAGEVPIVEVVPGNMPLPIYDIATINNRAYNLCSQLDEILINATFPQRYMQAGEGIEDETGNAIDPQVAPMAFSTSRVLLIPDESNIAPGFLSPPDGPAKIHIEERERLINAIYSLFGLERQDPDSQQVQSGVAKAYDFRETNARLASIAHASERAEEEILFLLNAYGFEGDFNINYNKDFNVRDFSIMLEDYLNIQKTDLPGPAKRYAMLELALQIADDASIEEKEEIRLAVEAIPDIQLENSGAPALDLFGGFGQPTQNGNTAP